MHTAKYIATNYSVEAMKVKACSRIATTVLSTSAPPLPLVLTQYMDQDGLRVRLDAFIQSYAANLSRLFLVLTMLSMAY